MSKHHPIKYEINENGCYVCTSHKPGKDGYPKKCFRIDGKFFTYQMHRYVYSEHFGPIPDGMVVMHSCDNPSCINPVHLVLGTPGDNSRDMVAKGRSAYGEKCARSKLSIGQVRRIKYGKESVRVLSELFGITQGNIWFVRKGLIWKSV